MLLHNYGFLITPPFPLVVLDGLCQHIFFIGEGGGGGGGGGGGKVLSNIKNNVRR